MTKYRALTLFGLLLLIPGSALCQNFVYADQCPGPNNDIGAKIMSCVTPMNTAMIPTAADGLQVGTIILPNTAKEPALATWATPVVLGPGVSLMGQGPLASYFECTVTTGDCLKYDASWCNSGCATNNITGPSNAIYSHIGNPATVYQGFTLTGYVPPTMGYSIPGFTPILAQNFFDFLDADGVTVREVVADGANGACFLFQDVNRWTERNLFENVSTMYNCNVGWRFMVQPGNPYHPASFGYNRFLDIQLNPNGAQTAFSFENDSNVYNSTFRVTVNKKGTNSKIIHMQDTAQFATNELHLYAEEDGSGGKFMDITSSSNVFTYFGEISPSPYTDQNNNIVSGAVVTHLADSANFKSAQNKFSNGVAVGTAQWTSGTSQPSGTCASGSLYSDTAGGSGSMLYVCVNSAWVNLK